MGAAEALVELAANVLLTEASSARANLATLADLVEHTPCYRLETDRYPGEIVQVLADAGTRTTGPPRAAGSAPP